MAGVVHPSPGPFPSGKGGLLVAGEGDFFGDARQNAIRVCQHIVVPEADDTVAVGFDDFGSNSVGGIVRMLPAVQFDSEAQAAASKVRNKVADRVLPGELCAAQLTRAQVRPQPLFRVSRIAPQLAREAGQSLSCQCRKPIPNPFPQGKGLSVAKLS